jgi:hypothetical protein
MNKNKKLIIFLGILSVATLIFSPSINSKIPEKSMEAAVCGLSGIITAAISLEIGSKKLKSLHHTFNTLILDNTHPLEKIGYAIGATIRELSMPILAVYFSYTFFKIAAEKIKSK